MKRKIVVTLETEIDEEFCVLGLNQHKTMFTNNTEYKALFVDNDDALNEIALQIEADFNYRITKVEDKLCGNVMWCE